MEEEKVILSKWTAFFFLVVAASLHVVSSAGELSTYIVQMDLSAMPRAFGGHRSWYASALSAATSASAAENLVYVYEHAIHGFSARLSDAQLRELKRFPGFVSCRRDVLLRPDTTHTFEFLRLNQAGGLWPAARYGEDVIIGVVDSGIWPESESFRDDGMGAVPARWRGACEEGTAFNSACNKKLIGARFFNKGFLAENPNATILVNSPRDTDGHGTHTSSTAAGNYAEGASFFGYAAGTSRGVAPRARLAVYKVLWERGAFASDIIAGVDSAIADGVDVISLSLGLDDVPLYDDPVAIATFAAVEKGVFVATSAGNRGPFLGLLHNGAPWLLTVGASTVDRVFSGTVALGNGAVIAGTSLYPWSTSPLRRLPLVSMGACKESSLLNQIRDKIVVCQANGTLDSVIERVTAAGVAGGLFISASAFIEYNLHFSLPATIVSPEEGQAVLAYINSSPNPTANFRFQKTSLGTTPAPAVPPYTSRGPGLSCHGVLKPDLVAPGSLVLASWPENVFATVVSSRALFSPFNILSGSSMACPHAAGVAALLKAVHPQWSPAAIRSAMMTTADPLDNTLEPIKDLAEKSKPATPLAMGSGQINPTRAMDPGLVYDAGPADYVNLLCAMNHTEEQIFTITRSRGVNCSDSSPDLNYPSFIAFFKHAETTNSVRKFKRTVTNVADGGWTYRSRVTSVKGFAIRVSPEVLVFKEKDEMQRFELTVEARVGMKPQQVLHGALTWEDDDGKHTVRSPIVATTFIPHAPRKNGP
ncbi:unnamed protein product [Spirodela intermedia]|uniref:Uncharacterized protein n=1 Tax=Spirodela intermedia TaxID=51605 RepID=A0A7I8KR63_SPIIN|nr:unnamed protein product [Spirodela intermedia]